MVRREQWLWIGCLVLNLGLIIRNRPWERGWETLVWAIPIVVLTYALIAVLNRLDVFARNRGIGEARFDSETGKLMPEDEKR